MNAWSVSSIKQRFLCLMIHGQGLCAQPHNHSLFFYIQNSLCTQVMTHAAAFCKHSMINNQKTYMKKEFINFAFSGDIPGGSQTLSGPCRDILYSPIMVLKQNNLCLAVQMRCKIWITVILPCHQNGRQSGNPNETNHF